ncbi:MAG: DUF1028 domain-containing protein [Myxococcota bacterium]|nr:DUF1028 domain-containing protein [Myxococcota bacterium]
MRGEARTSRTLRLAARPTAPPVSTFSIVARDPASGALGVAVQSRYFNVGAVVPWAEAGVGAVATQAFVEPGYGPRALALLREGASAAEALSSAQAEDPGHELRQVAVVDTRGGVASHTGSACIPFAGHACRTDTATQGNLLATDRVWDAMQQAFARARGPFAVRLVEALEAGQRAGGDVRGCQSAALLVVRPVSESEPWKNRVVDLRVEDHRKPIPELRRLLRMQQAQDALKQAELALGSGDVEGALEASDRALHLSRRHDETLFWVGVFRAHAGHHDEAVELLRQALRRNHRWRALLKRLTPPLLPPDPVVRRVLR